MSGSFLRFHGKRFIGDTSKNIVHDLLFEKKYTAPKGCQIDEIKIECIRIFSPDELEKAKREGYRPCKYCLPFNKPSST